MKNIVYSLLSLFVMASCSYESNVPGPQGPAGPGLSYRIIDVTAFDQDLLPFNQPGSSDFQYYVEFNAPEIDQFTYQNGVVIGYQLVDNVTYTMPNTVNFDGYFREYSMYYGIGFVGFTIKESDLQTEAPLGTNFFKVYIINADAKRGLEKGMSQSDLELYLRDLEVKGQAREINLSKR
jgi:hypothetical protein